MKPKHSLKQQIYHQVLKDIIQGKYQPDDIINEKHLIEEFGVSKSPVREALIELCNEKVLNNIPRFGYQVIRITDRDVKDIQDFRKILECSTLDRHWDMLTEEHINTLESLLEKNYSGSGEYNALEHWEINRRFHSTLISFFNNQYIYTVLEDALRFLTRAYAQFFWDKWHKTIFFSSAGHHKNMIKAMRENDKEKAILCLENDIDGFEDEEFDSK